MRGIFDAILEEFRCVGGTMGTKTGDLFGAFRMRHPVYQERLFVIASNGDELVQWEHVSVSAANRCPYWDEMSWIKDLFWRPDECVIQYHPAKKDYVNIHPNCLHLWKPIGVEIPTPPTIAV